MYTECLGDYLTHCRTCTIDETDDRKINRSIDAQSMLRFFVIIGFIDYQFSSIIDANRSVSKCVSAVDF